MARKVVFHDHAEHLVSQTPHISWQHLRMEVCYPHGGCIMMSQQLLPQMPVYPLGAVVPSLLILEWEGVGGPVFMSP